MKRILLGLIFIGLITSCSSIIGKMYGLKDPRVENFETLSNYLEGIQINNSNILIPKDVELINKVLGEFGQSIPQAVLFNSEGNRITYKETDQDCNAGLFVTIPNLNQNSKLKMEEGKNLEEFVEDLVYLQTQESITNFPNADFYLFINWAKYVGKLNEDHVKEWIELANSNEKVKIQVYKVNLDFQEIWGLELGKKVKNIK